MQGDLGGAVSSFNVLPLTSDLVSAGLVRVTIDPTRANGLRKVSQVMVDKVSTVPLGKTRGVIGRLSDDDMTKVGRNLGIWLGLLT